MRFSPLKFFQKRGCAKIWFPYNIFLRADVAQLVEHNLAKVGVAGSSPVVRSIAFPDRLGGPFSAKWPSGKAEACKAFTPGSNPGVASNLNSKRIAHCAILFCFALGVVALRDLSVAPSRVFCGL